MIFGHTKTAIQILSDAAKLLEKVSSTPRLDAEILLAHVLGVSRDRLVLYYSSCLNKNMIEAFEQLIHRRMQYEPIAYIVGYKEFYSLKFLVNRHVLIPRPETELLVDYAIAYAKPHARIIDIGTGSGAIAIAIKYHRSDCIVWATDISDDALNVAYHNACSLLGSDAITFIKSNIFDNIPKMEFDLIVSNPPYIDPLEYNTLQPDIHYEPYHALFADEQGFAIIRMLIEKAIMYLSNGGVLLIEIGNTMSERVKECARLNGLSATILNDYGGIPRYAVIRSI